MYLNCWYLGSLLWKYASGKNPFLFANLKSCHFSTVNEKAISQPSSKLNSKMLVYFVQNLTRERPITHYKCFWVFTSFCVFCVFTKFFLCLRVFFHCFSWLQYFYTTKVSNVKWCENVKTLKICTNIFVMFNRPKTNLKYLSKILSNFFI